MKRGSPKSSHESPTCGNQGREKGKRGGGSLPSHHGPEKEPRKQHKLFGQCGFENIPKQKKGGKEAQGHYE